MSAVWSATWRLLCLDTQTPFQRQTALSIPVSTILSGPNPYLRRGKLTEHVKPATVVSGGLENVRHSGLGFSSYSRREDGAVRFISIPSRWKSTSPGPERTYKSGPTSRFAPLSGTEIAKILGKNVNSKQGNAILRQLQHQRVSGTLDRGISAPGNLSARALAWLRKTYPFDEDAATIARLDKELEEEEKEIYSVYKPQQGAKLPDNYSVSVLDQIKEMNKLKAAKLKAAKEREAKEAEQVGENGKGQTVVKTAPRAIVARRTESAEWVKKYREKATSKLQEPPKMTRFQRLWPSTLVTLAVIGLCALFAQNYSPPSRKARLWPDIPPAAATVFTLIAMNVTIFLLWRIPPAWRFFNRHFVITPAYPYSSSIVANLFSHQTFSHLAMNMAVLWFVGTRLHNDIGRGNFLGVFFMCGAVSSYVSLSTHVFRNIFYTSSLGASGAICGLVATWLLLNADKAVSFTFLPELFTDRFTCYGILSVMIAMDVIGLARSLRLPVGGRRKVEIDYVSHLSGYAAGLGCAQGLRYQRRHWQPMDDNKEKTMGPMTKPIKAN